MYISCICSNNANTNQPISDGKLCLLVIVSYDVFDTVLTTYDGTFLDVILYATVLTTVG